MNQRLKQSSLDTAQQTRDINAWSHQQNKALAEREDQARVQKGTMRETADIIQAHRQGNIHEVRRRLQNPEGFLRQSGIDDVLTGEKGALRFVRIPKRVASAGAQETDAPPQLYRNLTKADQDRIVDMVYPRAPAVKGAPGTQFLRPNREGKLTVEHTVPSTESKKPWSPGQAMWIPDSKHPQGGTWRQAPPHQARTLGGDVRGQRYDQALGKYVTDTPIAGPRELPAKTSVSGGVAYGSQGEGRTKPGTLVGTQADAAKLAPEHFGDRWKLLPHAEQTKQVGMANQWLAKVYGGKVDAMGLLMVGSENAQEAMMAAEYAERLLQTDQASGGNAAAKEAITMARAAIAAGFPSILDMLESREAPPQGQSQGLGGPPQGGGGISDIIYNALKQAR